jgi:hypothetical protein
MVGLWLLLHDWIPVSVEEAHNPIRPLYQLAALVGSSAVLAALSFVAYLLGSMLRIQLRVRFSVIIARGRVMNESRPTTILSSSAGLFAALMWVFLSSSIYYMYRQLRTLVAQRLRETAGNLDLEFHANVLETGLRRHPAVWDSMEDSHILTSDEAEKILVPAYVQAIADDLPAVGIQLQAKNRDFWDTYDRQLAEAQFRFGIAPPLTLILTLLALRSSDQWWWLLLAAPVYLCLLGYRHFAEAALTLVQAVVLKMVEPPVMERLEEAIAKKREAEKKPPMSAPQVTTGTL